MECRLSRSSEAWSCQIKIRWEYDADGRTRRKEVEEIDFGPLLTDKAKVEPMLRRAQAAVLNPEHEPLKFLDVAFSAGNSTFGGQKQLAFSRNVVCVELCGPELVDLSFVDLPGASQCLR